jgi:hypothetical protein
MLSRFNLAGSVAAPSSASVSGCASFAAAPLTSLVGQNRQNRTPSTDRPSEVKIVDSCEEGVRRWPTKSALAEARIRWAGCVHTDRVARGYRHYFESCGLLLPVLNRAKDKAKRIQCLNNLHQMGIALSAYVQENREKYPTDPTSRPVPLWWPMALETYYKAGSFTNKAYQCPALDSVAREEILGLCDGYACNKFGTDVGGERVGLFEHCEDLAESGAEIADRY